MTPGLTLFGDEGARPRDSLTIGRRLRVIGSVADCHQEKDFGDRRIEVCCLPRLTSECMHAVFRLSTASVGPIILESETSR